MDCKDNFEAKDNNKTAAWITGIWRFLFWLVSVFNTVMDGFFIHKLFTAPDVDNRNHYAYLMLVVTITSFVSEHFAFSPIINTMIKNIENWKGRITLLTVCCISSTVSFWLEDFTTICLFFKIDGVYDTDNLADVINLFSSVAAGCINAASIIILNILYVAANIGALSAESNRFERCSLCKNCILEDRWCNTTLAFYIMLLLINIGTTYVAIRGIYLKDLDLKIDREEPLEIPFFIVLYFVIFIGACLFLFFLRLRLLLVRSKDEFWEMFMKITPELHGVPPDNIPNMSETISRC